ncbi:MAG: MFS transporter [Bacillota bacterium]
MEANMIKPRWGLLIVIWFILFFIFAMLQAVSPLLSVIIEELKITYWMGGFLYIAPLAAIVGFSYPLGLFADKIGVEKAITFGMLIAILFGFLRGYSTGFLSLLFTTLLYGTGLTFCFVSLAKFVKKYFPFYLLTIATGVYTSAIPTGSGIGISLTLPLAQIFGLHWRSVFWLWGSIAVPVLLIWMILVLRKQANATVIATPGSISSNNSIGKQPLFSGLQRNLKIVLIAGALFFLLNLFFYAATGWLPAYLAENGWEPEFAAVAASTVPLLEIPAILISPLISFGRKKIVMASGYLGIALSILVIVLFPATAWPACFTLGLSLGTIFPLILSIPAEIPHIGENVAKASGILLSTGYLGPLAGIPLLGLFRDIYGEFIPGFVLLICLAVVAALLTFKLPEFIGKERA